MGKEKSKFLSIIGTLATTTLALTSLITVWITINAWHAEREASRPYFTFQETPTVDIKDELRFEMSWSNVGSHPAVNLRNKVVIFHSSLTEEPVSIVENILVNDIPKDTRSNLVITIDKGAIHSSEQNIDPHYILVALNYGDPIINKEFEQTIYLRWDGVINGKLQPFYNIEMREKQQILNYLKKYNINLNMAGERQQ